MWKCIRNGREIEVWDFVHDAIVRRFFDESNASVSSNDNIQRNQDTSE